MTRKRMLGTSLIVVITMAGAFAVAEPQRWLFLFGRGLAGYFVLSLVVFGIYLFREGRES